MGMTVTQMISKFRERTSGLAPTSLINDAGVLEYLNRAYRFVIPRDVDGSYTEGQWVLECTALVDSYTMPDYVVNVRAGSVFINSKRDNITSQIVSIDQSFLDVETDLIVFQSQDREHPVSSTGSRPDSILLTARGAVLSPAPDEAYIVKIPARTGSSKLLNTAVDEALYENSVDDEIYAMAAVTAAAWEYLLDKEDHESAMREGASYEKYKSLMTVAAQGKPSKRRWKRSF